MKKVKNQSEKGLNLLSFLQLKSKKVKNIIKCLFIFLILLIVNLKTFSPEIPEVDKKELGKRYLELKRESEITEFNKKLKEEHPYLYVLAIRESGGIIQDDDITPNYAAYNKYGFIGAWQINVKYLPSFGIHDVTFEEFKKDPDNVFPPELQLYIVKLLIERNIKYLGWYYDYYPGKWARGIKITEEGMLYAAHLGGAYGLKRFLKYGNNPRDAYGTSIKDYLDYERTFWYKLDLK